MKKLRKDYEDILVEVEGADTDTQVIWPSNTNSNEFKLCYPKFSSKKGKNNTSATNTHDNSPVLSSRSQTQSNKKDENCNNTTAATSAVETSENSNKTKTNKELLNLDIDEKQLNCLQTENLKRLNRGELVELKENVSLEILWIQQAIQSRIQVDKTCLNLNINYRI